MLNEKNGSASHPQRQFRFLALRRATCVALALLLSLSFAFVAWAEGETSLPDSLVGHLFANRKDHSGISLQIEGDGSFVLSNWQNEERDGYPFNLYRAEFYGRFGEIVKLDGCAIYEMRILSIDEAGGMIYDVYYPKSDDTDLFENYLPWKLDDSIRIVPPLEPSGLCLIGVQSDNGTYEYSEYVPLK